jgi:hypothetical protein
MRSDRAISLARLRPNGDHATAKLRQQTMVFERASSKLKHLHVMVANLSVLRQRCGKPTAKSGHRKSQLKPHAAASGFCAAARWQMTRLAVLTDAVKLRKKFRRETAARRPFLEHARKLHNVPAIAADRAVV